MNRDIVWLAYRDAAHYLLRLGIDKRDSVGIVHANQNQLTVRRDGYSMGILTHLDILNELIGCGVDNAYS